MDPRVSAWLDFRGLDDARFIYTGSEARRHRLMDDSALFCLTRRPPPSLTLVVSGRALAWRALLAFDYQSACIMPNCTLQWEWHPCTPTKSASSVELIRCIMTVSARLMPLEGSTMCPILTAAFMDSNNGIYLNGSVNFLSNGTAIYLQGIHNHMW